MRKVDYMLARMRAKQLIRKVKNDRLARQMESQNVSSTSTTSQRQPVRPEQPAEGQGMELQPVIPSNNGDGYGGNNGLGGES